MPMISQSATTLLRSCILSLVTLSLLTQSPVRAAAPDSATLSRELAQAVRNGAQGTSFEATLEGWQKRYGRLGVVPLLDYAESAAHREAERYVALMGAARLGGKPVAHRISPFLKSSSWMLRSGALRVLSELKDPATGPATLALLQDPALAVRAEAIHTIQTLKPKGAAQALVQALGAGENYRSGIAQWVPGRALAALSVLKASEMAPKLLPLLDHSSDPALMAQTVATLESLTGRKLKPGAALQVRVREWKLALLPKRAAASKH